MDQVGLNRRMAPLWMLMMFLALALALTVGAVQAAPEAGAKEPARVEKVRGKVVFYEQDGDRFRRMAQQPESVVLDNVAVAEVSPKGYVLLETGQGKLWVDKMSVKLTAEPLPASCGRLVSSASDAVTAGVRGAGEGCK